MSVLWAIYKLFVNVDFGFFFTFLHSRSIAFFFLLFNILKPVWIGYVCSCKSYVTIDCLSMFWETIDHCSGLTYEPYSFFFFLFLCDVFFSPLCVRHCWRCCYVWVLSVQICSNKLQYVIDVRLSKTFLLVNTAILGNIGKSVGQLLPIFMDFILLFLFFLFLYHYIIIRFGILCFQFVFIKFSFLLLASFNPICKW